MPAGVGGMRCGGPEFQASGELRRNPMTKVLIAAVTAALLTVISAPASAQTQQTHPPQGPHRGPQPSPHPGPHSGPHPPPPGNYSSGQVFEQPVNPQFVYPP